MPFNPYTDGGLNGGVDPFVAYGYNAFTRPQWMSDAYQSGTLAQVVARKDELERRGYIVDDAGRIWDANGSGWGDVQNPDLSYLPDIAPLKTLPAGGGAAGTQVEDVAASGYALPSADMPSVSSADHALPAPDAPLLAPPTGGMPSVAAPAVAGGTGWGTLLLIGGGLAVAWWFGQHGRAR